ncbi:MAG: hypothetical protein A2252_03945 [Elusimicrobia bacterium RIFOXYA2_FULL_39_19]|nr:MAG: hypothetical protein A2252_03945 [Elusimicrobia bacterium RIFOXYA2_FULL_39_19]
MKQVYQRWIKNKITSSVSKNKIKLIFGARQTGKSTLLKELSDNKSVVINLQDRSERIRFERNPQELTGMLKAIKTSQTVLIDEIQKVPQLLDDIQSIYDENPSKYNFVITGSSARKLRGVSVNLIPGRVHQYHSFPVIMCERKKSKQSAVLEMPLEKNWAPGFPEPDIESMLLYGSLPGIIQEKPESARATLEAYAELYIEEEIRKESLVRNIGQFSRFLELAALESGNIMNLTGLSQQSGIAVTTLSLFYQVLVDTFVGYWLKPFSSKSRKRLLTTPKFYFFDTGVRNALARLAFDKNTLKLQSGLLFEQWVITELLHRCAYLGREYRLSFWKTVSGVEVDLVLEKPGEVIPIEVKWTDSPNYSDAKSLEIFLDTHPKICHHGFIVCRTPRRLQITKRVMAIPYDEL